MTGREYDLLEDARSLVAGQWLQDGEQLRSYAATGRGNYKSEIRGHPSAAYRAATAVGWAAVKLVSPVGIVTGGVPYWNEIRRFEGRPPGLVAFGEGRDCEAARLLKTGPHRSGIWILTDRRFGFAADRITSASDGKQAKGLRRDGDTLVLLDKVLEVPAARFVFEDRVTRGGDVYLRIRFRDGSGLDVHNR
ncbi:hypothetical protein [Glycomyces artemisiae]|uniref:Uncharacterized protein n=1 Tax=Glycomyces artemisiae TaxID=1076443 RepID=A0A2T0UCU9_9ACTN|nr:hypothetical protein [Glycomyces artemisiae]PRY55753.1 hypothetical protein B0I28_11266 [Glycomyces artemisiae]